MSNEKNVTAENNIKKEKANFELHVRLLQHTGLKVAEARAAAWLQGPQGLEKLLGKMGQAV